MESSRDCGAGACLVAEEREEREAEEGGEDEPQPGRVQVQEGGQAGPVGDLGVITVLVTTRG